MIQGDAGVPRPSLPGYTELSSLRQEHRILGQGWGHGLAYTPAYMFTPQGRLHPKAVCVEEACCVQSIISHAVCTADATPLQPPRASAILWRPSHEPEQRAEALCHACANASVLGAAGFKPLAPVRDPTGCY